MKTCSKCKNAYGIGEFYANPKTADKLTGWCKNCTRKSSKRAKAIARTDPIRRAVIYAQVKAWRNARPEAKAAHWTLNNSITRGIIKRPSLCSKCFCECKPEAHHEDYSQPLDVQWLCKSCHRQLHADKRVVTKAQPI